MNDKSLKEIHELALEHIYNRVVACIEQANQFFTANWPLPTIKLNQRGRAAGTAHLQKNEVRFNLYMYQQDPQKFVETVVPHEVAHLVVFNLYGPRVRPHGREWQAIMLNVYDLQPERTHDFLPKPPDKLFLYQCACQEHKLSIRRHNKIQQGYQYLCRNCRGALQLMQV